MGGMQASEFADMTGRGKGKISLDQALTWHLQSNHYPPVPIEMVKPCKSAINAVNKGMHDKQIKLPGEITWRGQKTAPASAIVDAHHLHSWLKDQGDE